MDEMNPGNTDERHQDLPNELLVEGAGQATVNGIYSRDGYFENKCVYKMRGKHENETCTFWLYHWERNNYWYISTVPRDEEPGSSNDIDWYRTSVAESCRDFPPMSGWTKGDELKGVDPAPKINQEHKVSQSETNGNKGDQEPPDEPEISREEALGNLFTDESICDMQIRGTDGVTVPACRAILAARSKIFRAMLCGNFAEAENSLVSVGYRSDVIQAILEYICTDEVNMFKEEFTIEKVTAQMARMAISLIDGANYFNLPKLGLKTHEWACSLMQQHPPIAFVILDECKVAQSATSDLIEECAMGIFRLNLDALLVSDTISELSSKAVESIIRDDKSQAEEYTLFRFLKAWADCPSKDNNASTDIIAKNKASRPRHIVAAEIAKYLHLDRISPSSLSTTVASSGLVSNEQLHEAYKMQALQGETQHGISYKTLRLPQQVWQSSNTSLFTSEKDHYSVELLNISPMMFGVHKWSIQIETYCGFVWLGVTPAGNPPSHGDWLGRQEGGWAYGSNGCVYISTQQSDGKHATFAEGSEVTLILDLNKNGGTLSAKVDNSPISMLFCDMISRSKGHGKMKGFLPAVSLKSPGSVRFLGMSSSL